MLKFKRVKSIIYIFIYIWTYIFININIIYINTNIRNRGKKGKGQLGRVQSKTLRQRDSSLNKAELLVTNFGVTPKKTKLIFRTKHHFTLWRRERKGEKNVFENHQSTSSYVAVYLLFLPASGTGAPLAFTDEGREHSALLWNYCHFFKNLWRWHKESRMA